MKNLLLSDAMLMELCEANLHKDTELGELLNELCWWEGGTAWWDVGEKNLAWLSGDNGLVSVKLKVKLKLS